MQDLLCITTSIKAFWGTVQAPASFRRALDGAALHGLGVAASRGKDPASGLQGWFRVSSLGLGFRLGSGFRV